MRPLILTITLLLTLLLLTLPFLLLILILRPLLGLPPAPAPRNGKRTSRSKTLTADPPGGSCGGCTTAQNSTGCRVAPLII